MREKNPKSRKESQHEPNNESSGRRDKGKSEKKHYVEKKEPNESKALGLGEFEEFREKRSKLRDSQMERKFGKELGSSGGQEEEQR